MAGDCRDAKQSPVARLAGATGSPEERDAMNGWTTCAATVPYTARIFMGSNCKVGLGGLGFPLALSLRNGIKDALFRARLARFMEVPAVPTDVSYGTYDCDLVRIPDALAWWREGRLPGAPAASAEQLLKVTADRLAPFLPIYRLPAGDAVSVGAVLTALTYLPGRLDCWRAPGRAPARRPGSYPSRRTRPGGEVRAEQVEEFADYHYYLRNLLLKEIPWQRRGFRSFAQPAVANQIARSILGIPVDLREGRLVKASEVTWATRRAAGYHPDDQNDALRLRAFVSRRVPRVLPKNRTHEGYLGSARGAAWSVALDRALNGPAPWVRNGDDTLANGPELAD